MKQTTPNHSIILAHQDVNLAAPQFTTTEDLSWMDFFDTSAAIRDFVEHMESLPSHDTERNTYRNYASSLAQFFNFGQSRALGLTAERQQFSFESLDEVFMGIKHGAKANIFHPLPTPQLMTAFYVWIKETGKGISPATFNCKYMAPLRIYFRALLNQDNQMPLAEYMRFSELKGSITRAVSFKLKTPAKEIDSPLYETGTRLNEQQVRAVMRSFDDTLKGKQHAALFITAISSGLRLSELKRVSLDSLKRDGEVWTITVRGKGGKTAPVPVGQIVHDYIMDWVNTYNATDTPTPILPHEPIWRGLTRYGKVSYHPSQTCYGVVKTDRTIYDRIAAIVWDALGIKFATHDTRRSCAALAYEAGMKLGDISKLLRHSNQATTSGYIGTPPDMKGRTLSTFITFS